MLTEVGFDHFVACAEAMKKVLGNEVGLALDCGPGWTVKDAIRFARAMEPLHLAWLEDMITGDYTQYPNAQVFKEVTDSTLRRFTLVRKFIYAKISKDLIETQAVNVLGPIRKMWVGLPN